MERFDEEVVGGPLVTGATEGMMVVDWKFWHRWKESQLSLIPAQEFTLDKIKLIIITLTETRRNSGE